MQPGSLCRDTSVQVHPTDKSRMTGCPLRLLMSFWRLTQDFRIRYTPRGSLQIWLISMHLTTALSLVLSLGILSASAGVIAYDNPTGAGNQTFPGSVGLDFNVGLEPLEITHLGAFDSNQDGFATTRTVAIYDRDNPATPYATVTLSSGTSGTLINGSRFSALGSPITLPAGFKGSVVLTDVSTDQIHNQGVGAGPLSTTNNGGGVVQFVGSGRYGSIGVFPGTADAGPVNRYQAGTFQFQTTTATPKFIAYDVAPSLTGNQNFGGPLGMDFDVGSAAIAVTHLGVFDSSQDGINGTLSAYIYDRDTQAVVAGPFAFTGTADPLVNGSRLRDIADITLPAGFHGTIVAEGYNAGELLYNSGGVPANVQTFTGDGNGLITFVGTGRYGNVAGTFPTNGDAGPANRYAAGTFAFMAIPEPASASTLACLGLALGLSRRRQK